MNKIELQNREQRELTVTKRQRKIISVDLIKRVDFNFLNEAANLSCGLGMQTAFFLLPLHCRLALKQNS